MVKWVPCVSVTVRKKTFDVIPAVLAGTHGSPPVTAGDDDRVLFIIGCSPRAPR